jgi:FKBP-type peptidyl-prolyl cis-trans isomerase/cyclophilin family peptidyl-prolyl cis-trans isomerase
MAWALIGTNASAADEISATDAVEVIKATETPALNLETEEQQISYVIGSNIGQMLKRQLQGFDFKVPLFVTGLTDALDGKEPAIPQPEMQKLMAEFGQKMQAKQKELQEKQAAEDLVKGKENLAKGTEFLAANAKKEGVKVLESGLQYKVLTEGSGAIPTTSDKVKVHYRGTLIDGTEFDSSFKRNQPATFGVTQVVAGWTEALQLMPVGSKWQLFIPADLAYGERGRPSIPANSTLIFDIELLDIEKGQESPKPKAEDKPKKSSKDTSWKTKLTKPEMMAFDKGKDYFWNLQTNKGLIKIKLMPEVAPMHATSTIFLTRKGFYDDITFHRVIAGFMAQGGCPLGTGTGSPGYKYDGEFDPKVKHDRPYLLSMANAGPSTDGSQFFITFAPTPHLNGKHTIFGEVSEGQDVVRTLEKFAGSGRGNKPTEDLFIVKATIEEKAKS